MRYDFLIDTYETERIKVISARSMFTDMISRCVPTLATRAAALSTSIWCISVSGEDIWFRTMLVGAPPFPQEEVRLELMRRYEEDSGRRLGVAKEQRRSGGGKAR